MVSLISIDSYIHKQALAAALINMVVKSSLGIFHQQECEQRCFIRDYD